MNIKETISIFEGRRLVLGVSGSIAAYKAVDLASKLTQAGADVDVVLTPSAEKFVSALTFQSITGRSAFTDDDLWGKKGHLLHIGLAEGADLLIIAPATANTISRLAHGSADSMLAVAALASRAPLMIAPAMDAGMYEHPATQANIRTLRQRDAAIIGPAEGRMASGMVGLGRMVEPELLMGAIRRHLGKNGPLASRRVVVTAGGTREPIDPVRVITNRSSGKQGFAVAQAALDFGADVTLITTAASLPLPVGAMAVPVETAAEMNAAVLEASAEADALIMVAAVADFQVKKTSEQKIKRRAGMPELEFEPTPDILAAVEKRREETGRPCALVGFAAESQDLVVNAREKLEEKNLSLIVANDIAAPDSGFGSNTNQVTLIDQTGAVEHLPLMSKARVAEAVCDHLVKILEAAE
jgi:phosphopantothenoylcysteine decarboxylase/phosphopantothenate--cysteine ligase